MNQLASPVMLDRDEEALVECVTAKLVGEFYIGQRVRFINADGKGTYGDGRGTIAAFRPDALDRIARIHFDGKPSPIDIYLWALRPL